MIYFALPRPYFVALRFSIVSSKAWRRWGWRHATSLIRCRLVSLDFLFFNGRFLREWHWRVGDCLANSQLNSACLAASICSTLGSNLSPTECSNLNCTVCVHIVYDMPLIFLSVVSLVIVVAFYVYWHKEICIDFWFLLKVVSRLIDRRVKLIQTHTHTHTKQIERFSNGVFSRFFLSRDFLVKMSWYDIFSTTTFLKVSVQ